MFVKSVFIGLIVLIAVVNAIGEVTINAFTRGTACSAQSKLFSLKVAPGCYTGETICKNAADVTLCNLFFADYKTVSAYLSCGNDTPLVTLKAYSAIDCTGESSTRNHAFNACTNDMYALSC